MYGFVLPGPKIRTIKNYQLLPAAVPVYIEHLDKDDIDQESRVSITNFIQIDAEVQS